MTAESQPTLTVASSRVEDTHAVGRALGRALAGCAVVALTGPLGAGKTQLVKGIAVGNGLDDPDRVTSPTFVLVNEYTGRLHLFHLDLYRLRRAEELDGLGFDEMIGPGMAVLVEWADRIPAAMPPDTLWVALEMGGAPQARSLTFTPTGPVARSVLAGMQAVD